MLPCLTRSDSRGPGYSSTEGDLPGYPSSHGCVHLPLSFAKDLFETTHAHDTTVVITQSTSKPTESALPIEELLGAAETKVSDASSPDAVIWQPDKSQDGSVAIIISGADKRIEILRGGTLIGQGPVTFAEPNEPLSEALYVKLQSIVGKAAPDWIAVLVAGTPSASAPVLSKLGLPSAIDNGLDKLMVPGTLLITTPGSLHFGKSLRDRLRRYSGRRLSSCSALGLGRLCSIWEAAPARAVA